MFVPNLKEFPQSVAENRPDVRTYVPADNPAIASAEELEELEELVEINHFQISESL